MIEGAGATANSIIALATSFVARCSQFLFILAAVSILLGVAVAADRKETAARPGETFRDCSACPEMVVLPAGSFLMGSSAEDVARDLEDVVPKGETKAARWYMSFETPQHEVRFSQPFGLGKYPVTRAEFAAFVHETGYSAENGCTVWIDHRYPVRPDAGWKNSGFPQTDRDPVVCVTRQDIKAYIAWLNGKLRGKVPPERGGPYRLPNEAEWEYAARAGTRTARWWGDAVGSDNANCDGCGSPWDKKQTAPVGSFRVNPFGVADMLGNVWESVEDCWNETYLGAPEDGRAWTTGMCDSRVMRGGAWESHPWVLRAAHRSFAGLTDRANDIGFRVARSIPYR